MYAFQNTIGGSCGGCHGYPPAANMTGLGKLNNYTNARIYDYVNGGGAHTVAGHIPKNARESQAWTNCSNCHYSTNHTMNMPVNPAQVNVIVDPKFKFNNASTIRYKATNNSCSNVSCHFKPSPNWVTGGP
jgi:cytochrome c553